MCEPAENGGSGSPSMSTSSQLQMSMASTALWATRTFSVGAFIRFAPVGIGVT